MSTDSRALREVVAAPDFRRLLSVRLLGQFADGMFQAALFSAVFFNPERATSAGEAAAAFATLLLPYSVVGPFAGVFLDRWRRQRVLLAGNLVRASVIVVFAGLLATLGPTSPPVVALALIVVSANRFILSGLSAALPHVVETRLLVTANSFSTTLGAGAAAAGGAAAVALRLLFGTDDLGAARNALVAALLYVVAAVLASRIASRLLGPTDPPQHVRLRSAFAAVARGVAQGAQHVRERGPAARGLAAISAHRFFYGLSFVATLLLYTEQGAIGRGFSGLGQVIVASVLGGLLAAIVTPATTRRIGTQRWIAVMFSAAAVVELAFGLPYTHEAFLVAAFFLGFAAQGSKICLDTLLQESVADDYRGRVFSFYDTLFNVSFVSAAAASAVLLPPNGKSYVVIVLVAGGYAVTALTYAVMTARRAGQEPPEPIVTSPSSLSG
ncbi:MAG: MFS transporter [Actinobacteria bacterium]|nr:MFS transporter [Actinomycetota bacterium]MBW3648518.1 MFS transporter [Actinomycetota bacterium]